MTATGPNGAANATVTLIPPTPVITGVGNGQLPLGIFSATITGTGFLASSVAQLNGTPLGTIYSSGALNVTGFYCTIRPGEHHCQQRFCTSQPFPVQIGVANAQVSAAGGAAVPGTSCIRPHAHGCRERPDHRLPGVADRAIQHGAGLQLQHHHQRSGRHAGPFSDQRGDESGSVAAARGVRAEPDLRDFHSER